MDRDDLRARQAGLKEAYRQDATRAAELVAHATFDARGTLGLDRHVPVGLSGIEVVATLDTDASDKDLQRLAELTDRYCVVGQSLNPHPTFRVVRRPRE